MFQFFIHYIVALLILVSYDHTQPTDLDAVKAFLLFLASLAFYLQFIGYQFKRLLRRAAMRNPYRQEYLHKLLISRLSVFGLLLFAFDIWVLNLPTFAATLPPFSRVPTLLALLFMGLFVFYQTAIWWFAYPIYRQLTGDDGTRVQYVKSNIVFALPVLLPFVAISGVHDLIVLSPFEALKQLITTPLGETIYFLTFLVAIAILGPALIQYFWRCRPLENGPLRERIKHLCQRAGVRYRNIMYWPLFGGRMITAGVMGLIRRFRYILITPALVRHLSSAEIDAVVAHEIGHVRYRHLFLYLFFMFGFFLVASANAHLFEFLLEVMIPFDWLLLISRKVPDIFFQFIQTLFLAGILVLYFRYIFGFFMRNFERQADAFVYTLFSTAYPLISTFHKIASTSLQPADRKNWHHFSIQERIDFLEACERDRRLIRQHNTKVWRSLVLFVVGLLAFSGLGFGFSYSGIGYDLRVSAEAKRIQRMIDGTPHKSELYGLLGNLYQDAEQFPKSIQAYENALYFDPRNAEALNGLAWLYATCPDTSLQDPGKALQLATRAARLAPKAHILDTLAESYFINGYQKEAIEIARRALAIAGEKKHYREQLIRFESTQL